VSTAPQFLVDALPPGGSLLLDGPEGRHAATVRRLRPGELVQVGDGRGALVRAVVRAVGRDRVELEVLSRVAVAAPALRVVLAQALVKGERGELAVELATEAGVDEVLPWRAGRCVARWEDGPRGERALARWRSSAREAAKQARRAWVPPVREAVTTAGLCERAGTAAGALVLHETASTGLAEAALPGHGELLVVVGPEGGVTDAELDELVTAGAAVVRLGPQVLRACTAAAVALGALGVLSSRWGGDTATRGPESPGPAGSAPVASATPTASRPKAGGRST